MSLTSDQECEYVNGGGNSCPVCDSADITPDPMNTDSGYTWCSVHCNDCDSWWRDLYTLTGVELESEGVLVLEEEEA